jgi:hypothetical protein
MFCLPDRPRPTFVCTSYCVGCVSHVTLGATPSPYGWLIQAHSNNTWLVDSPKMGSRFVIRMVRYVSTYNEGAAQSFPPCHIHHIAHLHPHACPLTTPTPHLTISVYTAGQVGYHSLLYTPVGYPQIHFVLSSGICFLYAMMLAILETLSGFSSCQTASRKAWCGCLRPKELPRIMSWILRYAK